MAEKKTIFTIFTKLTLTMLSVALIPLASLWYANYRQTQAALQAEVEKDLSHIADIVVAKVDDWTDMNVRALQQNAASADIVSMDPKRQTPLLKSITDTYKWYFLVQTTNADGNNVARSDDQPLRSYADREYFKQIMLQERPIGQQVLLSRTTGKPAFTIAVPIKDMSSRKAGILSATSFLDNISKTITDVKLGKTGFAFLVEDTGKVIAHGQPGKIKEELQDFIRHPALNKSASQQPFVFEEDGKQIIAKTKKAGLDWTLVVQQNYDEAFTPLQAAKWNALIVLLVTVVVVSIIAFVFARGLAKPIHELTTTADDYSRGELDATIPGTERSDEIGALARAIERMGISLKMAFEEISRKA